MSPKYAWRRREDGLPLLRSPQDSRRSVGRGGAAYLNRWDLVWVKLMHFGKRFLIKMHHGRTYSR